MFWSDIQNTFTNMDRLQLPNMNQLKSVIVNNTSGEFIHDLPAFFLLLTKITSCRYKLERLTLTSLAANFIYMV